MLLLIPGPVSTNPDVKAAFAQDYAPWDPEFRALNAALRARLLTIAGGRSGKHSVLPLQGCGHFAVEASIRTFVPPGGRILIPNTGAYAEHMGRLARDAGRDVVMIEVEGAERLAPHAVATALMADPTLSHVGLIYCETSTGICHDVTEVGRVVAALGRRTIIDAVSAFGALPIDVSSMPEADAIVFTSNKCLEGLPGLGFIVAPIDRIRAAKSNAGSWSFDLADILQHGEDMPAGTWRFTPSPQAVAALMKALDIYDAEGGQPARLARYSANCKSLYHGILALGLTPCVPFSLQGPIVVNVHAPNDQAWELQAFVRALKNRGVLISNFYNTDRPSFRVGCIGAVTPIDMEFAIAAISASMGELGVKLRQTSEQFNEAPSAEVTNTLA